MNTETLLKKIVDWTVEHIEYILFRLAPISAALLSGIAAARALEGYLYPGWIVAAVIVIEVLGLTSGYMIQRVSAFNRLYDEDKRINSLAGYATFGLYVIVVVGIILAGETIPTTVSESATVAEKIRSFVPLVFPFFTVTGALVIAIREHISRVENDTEIIEKARDDEERAARDRALRLEDEERARRERIEDEERRRQYAREDAEHALSLEARRVKIQQRAVRAPRATSDQARADGDTIEHDLRAAVARGEKINQTEWAGKYGVNRGSIARRLSKISEPPTNGVHA